MEIFKAVLFVAVVAFAGMLAVMIVWFFKMSIESRRHDLSKRQEIQLISEAAQRMRNQ